MEELIHQFGIDWKLLAAQAVNFFVLLYVLKRFAYGPIIAMLAERRKKIEEGLVASEESKKRLTLANVERKEILLVAEEESVRIVSQAESKAREQGKTILQAAEEKSERIIEGGHKKLEEDRKKLEEEVNNEAVNLIKKGLTRTIGRMNPTERDEMLIKDALRELSTLK